MLNGTAVVDRMALAILENLQGDVPDVLQAFGRTRVTRGKDLRRVAVERASRASVVTSGTSASASATYAAS